MVRIVAGGDTITATNNHPFYLPQLGKYLRADSLRQNMKLLALTGALLTVHAVEAFDTTLQVYNFEVEEYHNYFVGEEGVLVHNDCALVKAGLRQVDDQGAAVFDRFDEAFTSLPLVEKQILKEQFRAYLESANDDLLAFFRGTGYVGDLPLAEVQVQRVKAWGAVSSGSDDASRAVRNNPDNLATVEEYLSEYPDRLNDVRTGFADAGNKHQYVDDLLGPAPFGSRNVKHRVRGLFQGIDVNDNLAGQLSDTPGFGITTTVSSSSPNGQSGEFLRVYDPNTKEFEMQVAFRNDAPPFLEGQGVPLIQGEGTPTQMYVTLRQIKMMQIPEGGIETLRMSTIENKETILWLAAVLKDPNNGITHFSQVGDLILDSPNAVAGYAVSTMKQAGYRSVSAQIVDEVGIVQPITIGELMNMSSYDITLDDLARYSLSPQDETFREFDILIDLAPF